MAGKSDKKQPEQAKPEHVLVVRQPFLHFQRGDRIEEALQIEAALQHYGDHVTRVAA